MKKILLILLCLLLTLPVSVSADLPRVVDEAGLLSADEISNLESSADALALEYEMDVLILTVESLNGMHVMDFADQYYDSHGYGTGTEQSGIVFLLSISEREWAVRTIGEAKYAVSDYEIDDIIDTVWNDLRSGNYYETFDVFLSCVEDEYYAYRNDSYIHNTPGAPDYDPYPGVITPDYPGQSSSSGAGRVLSRLAVALLIGAVVAAIALFVMRSQMNTARAQSGARSYMTGGTYDLYRHQDIFLYSRTSRIKKQDPNTSGGGGGRSGGGGMHHSSGGSRGGRSGKF